jgi:hypothetical protein
MSLITPANVGNRGGWKITALGRMIRPARMRPIRPLVESKRIDKISAKGQDANGITRAKRMARNPLTRARRRTIDPTKWGSVHLKGVFLGAERIPTTQSQVVPSSEADGGAIRNAGTLSEDGITIPGVDFRNDTSLLRPASPVDDVAQEKERSLALLHSLFGDLR